MPDASSSPIDPAIGQLLAAVQCPDPERGRLLPVLAAVPAMHTGHGAARARTGILPW